MYLNWEMYLQKQETHKFPASSIQNRQRLRNLFQNMQNLILL